MAIARVERRLAAIMAADVVGYSRLVEIDEAGTLAAIKDLRREVLDPLLAESHGRIVKLMGDGAIVEFGSVVDAVACAVAVQKGAAERQADVAPERRIVFRIGVNLGDVVVEGEDLLGDGVNVGHGSSSSARRAACWCPGPSTIISRASSTSPWTTWASSGSRTSRARSASGASDWTEPSRYAGERRQHGQGVGGCRRRLPFWLRWSWLLAPGGGRDGARRRAARPRSPCCRSPT